MTACMWNPERSLGICSDTLSLEKDIENKLMENTNHLLVRCTKVMMIPRLNIEPYALYSD